MIKTTTNITALPEINDFKIKNHEDYNLVSVTAAHGEDNITVSFPWCHTLPFKDEAVQKAMEHCRATAVNALEQHIITTRKAEARAAESEAAMTPIQQFWRYVKRELAFMWGMTALTTTEKK
jgi:hypothetical protein